MSRFTPSNILQENSLSLVIYFTRTSPKLSRQARIEALQGLVDACSRAIECCLDAALAVINEEDKYCDNLIDIGADLPADVRPTLAQMTDIVGRHSRDEVEAIRRDVRTLKDCRIEAEQGREYIISPPPPLRVI